MKQKVIVLALSAILLTGGTSTVFANSTKINVDMTTAMKVAYGFLNARENEENVEKQVPEGYTLVNDLTMYDGNNDPSAYKFDILDKNKNYSGYIVVGAQEEYAPIVEFCISEEETFFDNATNCDKVYYLGGLEYYGQDIDNNTVSDIQSNMTVAGDITNMIANTPITVEEKTDYTAQWTEILEGITEQEEQMVSTFGSPGNIIANPEDYETDYNSLNIQTMPWAASGKYVYGNTFPDYDNHCGPLAITNLMILGYNSYGLNLLQSGDNYSSDRFDNTFNAIWNLAGKDGSTDGEMLASEVRDVAFSYLKNRYGDTTKEFLSPTETRMKNYIKNGVLSILHLDSHYIYGSHFVVPYGYEEYKYDSGSNIYLAIADGWVRAPRYVRLEGQADGFAFVMGYTVE